MKNKTLLIIGDILVIAILTIVGFAMHDETDLSFIPRMGTTFFPLLIAWFLIAPWFGLFDNQVILNQKNLWRIAVALLFATPFATTLRSAILNNAVLPLFVLILSGSTALGMIAWRWIYILVSKRKE